MNPRIAKEFRLISPVWVVTAVLLLATLTVNPGNRLFLQTIVFWLGCCTLSVLPIARDWSFGRMGNRRSSCAVFCRFGSCSPRSFLASRHDRRPDDVIEIALVSCVLASLFALSVGLWLSVRIREVKAAIAMAIFCPSLVLSLTSLTTVFLEIPQTFELGIVLFVVLLSPMAYVSAKRMFLNWDDHHHLRQEVSLSFRSEGRSRNGGLYANLCALTKKELHLQQISFIFIGGFLFCGYLARLDGSRWGPLSTAMAAVALFCPILLGITSVCEEHRIGVQEQHLTFGRRVGLQWLIKFALCFGFSSLLGGILFTAVHFLKDSWNSLALRFVHFGVMNEIAGDPIDLRPSPLYLIAMAFGVAAGMAIGAMFRHCASSFIATGIFLILLSTPVGLVLLRIVRSQSLRSRGKVDPGFASVRDLRPAFRSRYRSLPHTDSSPSQIGVCLHAGPSRLVGGGRLPRRFGICDGIARGKDVRGIRHILPARNGRQSARCPRLSWTPRLQSLGSSPRHQCQDDPDKIHDIPKSYCPHLVGKKGDYPAVAQFPVDSSRALCRLGVSLPNRPRRAARSGPLPPHTRVTYSDRYDLRM